MTDINNGICGYVMCGSTSLILRPRLLWATNQQQKYVNLSGSFVVYTDGWYKQGHVETLCVGLLVSFRDPDPYERPAAVISQQVGFLCIHVYLPVIADIEGMWIHHFADDCSFTLHGSICSDSWIFRLRPHKTLEYPSKSLWGSHCTEIMPLAVRPPLETARTLLILTLKLFWTC